MPSLQPLLSRVASFIDNIPGVYQPTDDLETTIADLAFNTVTAAAAALFILTLIAVVVNKRVEVLKLPVFILMITVIVGSTLTLISSTVYLNVKADSGGPVHWHADFEFWACGNELELRDPTGFLSNKIGTSTLHEHDDRRIHLEGVVVDEVVDASVGKFMHVIGGAVTAEALVVPLNADGEGNLYEDEEDGDGSSSPNTSLVDPFIFTDPEVGKVASFETGGTCGDDAAEVQVFVYNYNDDDKTYEQRKLDNPRDYVFTDDPNVPPGDCIIFEYGPSVEKTDKLCSQYGIRDIDRCEEFGVEPDQREICEVTQLNYDSDADYRLTPATEPANEEVIVNSQVVHQDQSVELLRLACEQSRIGIEVEPGELADTLECQLYDQTLASSPSAQAEVDAAGEASSQVQGATTEEGVL